MSSQTAPRSVASSRTTPDLLKRITYADPTGETAVKNLLSLTGSENFTLVDAAGNPVFIIKRDVLIEEVMPHLRFTTTRRGDNLRAQRKNAPAGAGTPGRGEVTTAQEGLSK